MDDSFRRSAKEHSVVSHANSVSVGLSMSSGEYQLPFGGNSIGGSSTLLVDCTGVRLGAARADAGVGGSTCALLLG